MNHMSSEGKESGAIWESPIQSNGAQFLSQDEIPDLGFPDPPAEAQQLRQGWQSSIPAMPAQIQAMQAPDPVAAMQDDEEEEEQLAQASIPARRMPSVGTILRYI